ncbi:hypothetical protein ADEAN_000168900 [Angomonas deanei]|uniref:Uncharacterized protein n=1 Tax=Angomonas deanei TaxID=59799 RepID=A0A7G2C523_9TRYP|nr:hypothetical protein ADEAN_000168900 [Angomonas deanei]
MQAVSESTGIPPNAEFRPSTGTPRYRHVTPRAQSPLFSNALAAALSSYVPNSRDATPVKAQAAPPPPPRRHEPEVQRSFKPYTPRSYVTPQRTPTVSEPAAVQATTPETSPAPAAHPRQAALASPRVVSPAVTSPRPSVRRTRTPTLAEALDNALSNREGREPEEHVYRPRSPRQYTSPVNRVLVVSPGSTPRHSDAGQRVYTPRKESPSLREILSEAVSSYKPDSPYQQRRDQQAARNEVNYHPLVQEAQPVLPTVIKLAAKDPIPEREESTPEVASPGWNKTTPRPTRKDVRIYERPRAAPQIPPARSADTPPARITKPIIPAKYLATAPVHEPETPPAAPVTKEEKTVVAALISKPQGAPASKAISEKPVAAAPVSKPRMPSAVPITRVEKPIVRPAPSEPSLPAEKPVVAPVSKPQTPPAVSVPAAKKPVAAAPVSKPQTPPTAPIPREKPVVAPTVEKPVTAAPVSKPRSPPPAPIIREDKPVSVAPVNKPQTPPAIAITVPSTQRTPSERSIVSERPVSKPQSPPPAPITAANHPDVQRAPSERSVASVKSIVSAPVSKPQTPPAVRIAAAEKPVGTAPQSPPPTPIPTSKTSVASARQSKPPSPPSSAYSVENPTASRTPSEYSVVSQRSASARVSKPQTPPPAPIARVNNPNAPRTPSECSVASERPPSVERTAPLDSPASGSGSNAKNVGRTGFSFLNNSGRGSASGRKYQNYIKGTPTTKALGEEGESDKPAVAHHRPRPRPRRLRLAELYVRGTKGNQGRCGTPPWTS